MDRNRGIWGVIACILVVGIIVTFSTNKFIARQEETARVEIAVQKVQTEVPEKARMTQGVKEVPEAQRLQEAETAAPEYADAPVPANVPTVTAASGAEGDQESLQGYVEITPLEGTSSSLKVSDQSELRGYYLERLNDLDTQIQKMRAEDTDSTTYSMKNAAEKELKLWDNELNTIYMVILKQMSEDESWKLVEEERSWMKERDSEAVGAAKKYSGGTIESLEYTAALAESTKARAYELVEEYLPEVSQ